MYFRNQEKLMKNAKMPEAEQRRINQKMRFQMNHADVLSQPKMRTLRKKFDM